MDADGEDVLTLTAGEATVTVHPDSGGRIGRITVAGIDLLVPVPPPDQRRPLAWGAYVMAPWAGRIREGRFQFEGTHYRLACNHADGDADDVHRTHSIHGTVWDRAWEVERAGAKELSLTCALAGALDWPFSGSVRHELTLHPDRLDLALTVATDDGRFPAELGWHPWFRTPDRLVFNPTEMYRRDPFGIPTGELVVPTPGPWDDCFVNTEPVRLHYDRHEVPTITVLSDCAHWVLFDELPEATCVEPQSGPPDAFNLVHHVVTADEPLHHSMTIAW